MIYSIPCRLDLRILLPFLPVHPALFPLEWSGAVYFYGFLPSYLEIPFWSVVGLVILLSILKTVLLPKFSNQRRTKKS